MTLREELQQTARLAALNLTESELDAAVDETAAILRLVEDIPTADSDISHSFAPCGATREDIVTPSFSADELLKNAPLRTENCFIYRNGKAQEV